MADDENKVSLSELPLTDIDVENASLNELWHSGTPHDGNTPHSGRFPWGSGDNAFQRPRDFYSYIRHLEIKGLSNVDIARSLNMSTTELKAYKTVAKETTRKEKVARAKELSEVLDDNGKPMSRAQIGKIIGEEFDDGDPIGESTIRNYLNPNKIPKNNVANVADFLMKQVNEKGMIDVGDKVDREIGITKETMNAALKIAEANGYVKLYGSVEQVAHPGQSINYILLAPPGTEKKEAYSYKDIHTITDYMSTDNGLSFREAFVYPKAINKSRVMIRYPDEGDNIGAGRDGEIQIREGVKDLSLGNSRYAQVRILVDNGGGKNDLYLKGMGVYYKGKEPLPDGVDIVFNTNKPKGTPFEKVLKSVKDNLDKDPSNPFGSAIKEHGGQSYYDDPNGDYTDPLTGKKQSLSAINKRSDEGDWNEWSNEIPSQMLSKQPKNTIAKQLSLSLRKKVDEYNEIMKVDNPTVKAKLLDDFAGDCDTSAKNLKAAAFPNMNYNVILPVPSLKDNEIFAPNYPEGTQLALIRFPHGGTFEIPILTVNNHNKDAIDTIGLDSRDAVGINGHNATILSGADFDGDTVLTIPTNNGKVKIQNREPLEGLKNFTTDEYGPDAEGGIVEDKDGNKHYFHNGVEYELMDEGYKQKQMGIVSNLITDMTLKGATTEELERAVKHSMVVIDAVKHKLDYKSSYLENGIKELHDKYQKHEYDDKSGGASTLISRAKNPTAIPKRAEGAFILNDEGNPDNGNVLEFYNPEKKIYKDPKTGKLYNEKQKKVMNINPETGEKLYHDTKEGYYKVKYKNDDNKTVEASIFYKREDGKYVRPRYIYDKDDTESLNNLYFFNKDGVVVKYDPEVHKLITHLKKEDTAKMDLTNDAFTLSSGTVQENYYAEYANKLKDLANSARLNYLYYSVNAIPYSKEAKAKYITEWKSLEAKVRDAELNAPKERAANIIATANINAKIDQADEAMDDESIRKLKQNELTKARARLGAHNARFIITEKEWEAVQAGAFSKSRLESILRYADQDVVRKLATPREEIKLSDADVRRIKGLSSMGESNATIAARLHVSISTVIKYLGEGE